MNRRILIKLLSALPPAWLLPWRRVVSVRRPILLRLDEWFRDACERGLCLNETFFGHAWIGWRNSGPLSIHLTRAEIEELRDTLDELRRLSRGRAGPLYLLGWRSVLKIDGELPGLWYRGMEVIESEESDLP